MYPPVPTSGRYHAAPEMPASQCPLCETHGGDRRAQRRGRNLDGGWGRKSAPQREPRGRGRAGKAVKPALLAPSPEGPAQGPATGHVATPLHRLQALSTRGGSAAGGLTPHLQARGRRGAWGWGPRWEGPSTLGGQHGTCRLLEVQQLLQEKDGLCGEGARKVKAGPEARSLPPHTLCDRARPGPGAAE